MVDGRGMPLSVAAAGANTNDHKLMRETLGAIATARPQPSREAPQNLRLDKGYDYDEPRALAQEFAFTLHLRTRGEELGEGEQSAGNGGGVMASGMVRRLRIVRPLYGVRL